MHIIKVLLFRAPETEITIQLLPFLHHVVVVLLETIVRALTIVVGLFFLLVVLLLNVLEVAHVALPELLVEVKLVVLGVHHVFVIHRIVRLLALIAALSTTLMQILDLLVVHLVLDHLLD